MISATHVLPVLKHSKRNKLENKSIALDKLMVKHTCSLFIHNFYAQFPIGHSKCVVVANQLSKPLQSNVIYILNNEYKRVLSAYLYNST